MNSFKITHASGNLSITTSGVYSDGREHARQVTLLHRGLKPLALRTHSWAQTEEGYHSEDTTYVIDGRSLVQHWESDSRDCDGRFSRTASAVWTGRFRFWRWRSGAARLWGGWRLTMDWDGIEQAQRDYSAEAMNY